MNFKNKKKQGFTLIELLVVIAIIAVLMVVVLVTLNPSELLKQSRDSNRLSDMATLKTSISLFQADVVTASTSPIGLQTICYSYLVSSSCANWMHWGTTNNVSSSRAVDGTGWIPVAFSQISSGAPITQLPIDPVNTAANNLYYSYTASGTSLFKLAMHTESVKFSASGTADVESTDGGYSTSTYETGPGVQGLTGL